MGVNNSVCVPQEYWSLIWKLDILSENEPVRGYVYVDQKGRWNQQVSISIAIIHEVVLKKGQILITCRSIKITIKITCQNIFKCENVKKVWCMFLKISVLSEFVVMEHWLVF